MPKVLRAVIIRHWYGRIALVPTLVVTVIGLRLILSWFNHQRPPDWPLGLFAALTLISLAILAWQVVGAARAVRRDGSGLALAAGVAASGAAVVYFVVAELDSYASRAANSGGLPPVMPLPVENGAVLVDGTFTWPLYKRFCATLLHTPDLGSVSLHSDGGLVPVARAMAARILERRLDTRATGLCASACTLTFMAGANRRLGPEGALGFHGYALLGYVPTGRTKDEEARDRAWLASRGVDHAFITRIFATDHDTLWRPDADRLRAAGVLTEEATPDKRPPHPLQCDPQPGQAASP